MLNNFNLLGLSTNKAAQLHFADSSPVRNGDTQSKCKLHHCLTTFVTTMYVARKYGPMYTIPYLMCELPNNRDAASANNYLKSSWYFHFIEKFLNQEKPSNLIPLKEIMTRALA